MHKQRNPYLKRIELNTPHKYSYDIETGKYFLHAQNQPDIEINKIGTLKPKFKHTFSGFATHKQRYAQAKKQPAFMHYVPDLSYSKKKSFYTPYNDKFAGYAQYPYKTSNRFPQHLGKANDLPENLLKSATMRKCQSQVKKQIKTRKNGSIILQHSMKSFLNQEEKEKYFNISFTSMTESKPLPRKQKKSCYNYKCKQLKHFVFNDKDKMEESTNYSFSSFCNTFGINFHQTSLRIEDQENKLITQK